jgi:hypothetical protein
VLVPFRDLVERAREAMMRLGILSDIHANIEALSTVLEAFRHESIFLGV